MAESCSNLAEYIARIPEPEEIRAKLSENFRQKKLLQQLLRISEQQRRVEETKSCK